jgi:hypothetical protein
MCPEREKSSIFGMGGKGINIAFETKYRPLANSVVNSKSGSDKKTRIPNTVLDFG